MASTRAADVAELLWELKRAGKVATFSAIANRAGFSPGTGGRAIKNTLATVRRDWPHLQWWRAIDDNGTAVSEQADQLREIGIETSQADGDDVLSVQVDDEMLMDWEAEAAAKTGPAAEDA